jgi:hypothetical protein
MVNRSWSPILAEAARLVKSYTYLITLRQLHYLLLSAAGIIYRNTTSDYTQLSDRTAAARRDGKFQSLLDQTRQIHRHAHWDGPPRGPVGAAMADDGPPTSSLFRRRRRGSARRPGPLPAPGRLVGRGAGRAFSHV